MSDIAMLAEAIAGQTAAINRLAEIMSGAVIAPAGSAGNAAAAAAPAATPRKGSKASATTAPAASPEQTASTPSEPDEPSHDGASSTGASYEDCRQAIADLSKAKGREAAEAVLNRFKDKDNKKAKAGRVSQVDDSDYDDLLEAAKAALAEEDGGLD